MFLAAGETSLDDWIDHSTNSKQVYVDVRTGLENIDEDPIYICSISGKTGHWATTGGSSIYEPDKTGFRVNIRWAALPPDGRFDDLSAADARANGWTITWAAFSRK